MKVLAAAAIAATTMVLAGCGGGDSGEEGAGSEASSPSASPSSEAPSDEPTESEEPEDPFAPNVGNRALQVGQARKGEEVVTTLLEVTPSYESSPETMRFAEAGMEWLAIRVRTCVRRNATHQNTSASTPQWAAVMKGGTEYRSDSYFSDWPTPAYPDTVVVQPGRCVEGWMALEVPKGSKPRYLAWRPDYLSTVAEWRL